MHAVDVQTIHRDVQHHAGARGEEGRPPRVRARAQQPARGRPQQPDQSEQHDDFSQCPYQRVRMAAVVQQVAQRCLQQPREHEVQVGEIARQAAECEQQARAHALRVGFGFSRNAAIDQCADAEADDGVGNIVHAAILPKSQARGLSAVTARPSSSKCISMAIRNFS